MPHSAKNSRSSISLIWAIERPLSKRDQRSPSIIEGDNMRANERWAHLTASAASCMNASDKEAFEAGQHAIWIGRVFGDYVGAPERGRVHFYALEWPTGPGGQFKPAHTGWAAVSRAGNNWWQFGLGIQLER